jgi:hypothetical protein
MKANTDHFKQFLVYCSARGLVYGFDPQLPRMQVSFQGSYVNFEIPTTVEEFDYLTSKVFPEKLGVSSCRFAPETVLDQYKVYANRQSVRGASA